MRRYDWLWEEDGERNHLEMARSEYVLPLTILIHECTLMFQFHSFCKKITQIAFYSTGKFRVISLRETKKSTDKIFYSIYNKCKEINTNKTWL